MNSKLKTKLNEMVKEFKTEETTDIIRLQLNSKKIHEDVQKILILKKKYQRLEKSNPVQFKKMARTNCEFLFTTFPNIFNRLLKNEVNLDILLKMIHVLEKIESGELDQHEGSFVVGGILKKIFIDSALNKKNETENKKKGIKPKKISWNDFKRTSNYKENI
tara:strand:- start:299 stop:784 length:486 start_codon:yes stop_codon:yes gene_type:complete